MDLFRENGWISSWRKLAKEGLMVLFSFKVKLET